MADHSHIEWTEATWNPIAGCSIVSPGCTNCYAMRRVAPRLAANPATPHYAGTVQPSKAGPVWTGRIGIASDRVLAAPLRWTKPRRIFVNSTSDLLHEDVPDTVIDRIFAVMALCPRHTFQVLTKRAKRMRAYMSDERSPYRIARVIIDMAIADKALMRRMVQEIGDSDDDNIWPVVGEGDLEWPDDIKLRQWPLPSVWLGVSAERQQEADQRIPDLLATPSAIRFVSAEPLIGPIDLRWIAQPDEDRDGVLDALTGDDWVDGHGFGVPFAPARPGHEGRKMDRINIGSPKTKLDWIIVGGESGNGARPMHPAWARSIRDQCAAAGTAFFFKQWGEWGDDEWLKDKNRRDLARMAGSQTGKWDPESDLFNLGKKRAGRLLDGVEHNGFPEPRR